MEEEGDERGMSVGEHEREKEREEEAIGRAAIESAIDAIGKSCVFSCSICSIRISVALLTTMIFGNKI